LTLLLADDPAPVTVLRGRAGARLLFICDHAGRATPRRLGDLGLDAEDLGRHIAWDIGAGELTARLADRFEACAILQTYSRLVIDCNRDPDAADAIPEEVDGTVIPGNIGLSAPDRAQRRQEIHAPYHETISGILDARVGSTAPPVPVFVHSFTPRLGGTDRPWKYGVLHDGSSAFAVDVLARLRDAVGEAVGDNEPYSFGPTDFSAPRHALSRGLQFLELEVRQDLLSDPRSRAETAELLEQVLHGALAGG
jgi:predicted N-formylglutamate amidohydrolase